MHKLRWEWYSLIRGFFCSLVLTGGVLGGGAFLCTPAWAEEPPATSIPPSALEEDEEAILLLAGTDEVIARSPRPPQKGRIQLRKFRKLQGSPEADNFQSQGNVQVAYVEADGTETVLDAQDVDYREGEIRAKGGVRLRRPEGTFTGQEIRYNFQSRSGYVTEAMLIAEHFRLQGQRIETGADGTYRIVNGTFTTCVHGRPDYRIRAKRLTVQPERYVSASGITFYAGGTPLLSLPSLRRNLRTTGLPPTPFPGYSRREGLTFRLRETPIEESRRTLDYDLRVGLKRFPTGSIVFQQDLSRSAVEPLPPRGLLPTLQDPLRGLLEQINAPTYQEYGEGRFGPEPEPRITLYAAFQNQYAAYHRRRSDLSVSRFPELGVRFANLLGLPLPPLTPEKPKSIPIPPPLILDAMVSLGAINEAPTNRTAGRLQLETGLFTQPLVLGRRLSARLALHNALNLYTEGSVYQLFAPEVELSYTPTQTSLLRAAYRYQTASGRSPFVFDTLDVRHELRLLFQVGGPWGLAVETKYDLDRLRAYDTEVALLRNLDCMQLGLGYRARTASINLIVRLLPPLPSPSNAPKS